MTDSIAAVSRDLAQRGVAYADQIARAALEHRIDPKLLAAVAAQETGGPGSNAGRNIAGDGGHGHGLFQIDDRWHEFARSSAARDPQANADYAAGMLSGLIRRYGSVRAALSAYNSGSPDATGTVTTWQDGSALGYADSVLRHYGNLGGGLPSEQPQVAAQTSSAIALPLSAPPPLPDPAQYDYRRVAGFHNNVNSAITRVDYASLFSDDDNDVSDV